MRALYPDYGDRKRGSGTERNGVAGPETGAGVFAYVRHAVKKRKLAAVFRAETNPSLYRIDVPGIVPVQTSLSHEALRRIHKAITAAEMVEAVHKLKRVGMRASVIAILGLGGRELSVQHAEETGRVVSAMDPEYFSLLTLLLVPGTERYRPWQSGTFELPEPAGLLHELRQVIAQGQVARRATMFFWGIIHPYQR